MLRTGSFRCRFSPICWRRMSPRWSRRFGMSLPAVGGESGQEKGAVIVGLRIDVCTYQGFRQGVPRLLDALAKRKIRATFFPAMGPDRSGRAVLRFFRKKGFLTKMLRTGAARMYGVRTALYGTLLPAPM